LGYCVQILVGVWYVDRAAFVMVSSGKFWSGTVPPAFCHTLPHPSNAAAASCVTYCNITLIVNSASQNYNTQQ